MTNYNKTTLATFFAQGDVPQGTDYANLINSQVNLVETAIQAMAGPLSTTELDTPLVSAAAVNVTGSFTIGGNFGITGKMSAASLNVTGDVSAATGTVYASAMRSTNGFIGSVGIVSAAGTAQATAASLTFVVNRGKGIADGQTTGFTPLTNQPGLVQYLFNEGVSANLWPPTGGTINGLAANAAYALAASAMVTIVHLTASAYGVK